MTEAEALEILIKDDDDMRKGYFCLNDFTALEVAKKALEKQTEKLVHEQLWSDTKCDCGHVFSECYEDGYYEIPHKNKTKYCPNCGQRLYWR